MPEETEIKGPEKGSIDYAVAQLLKDPEDSDKLTEEPDAEPEEELEEEEVDMSEESDFETESLEDDSEDEEEAHSEEDEEETEDEETEEEEEELFTVKVGDDEYEVNLDELRNGYQRQQDYTKKTQALAEQRKAYEENASKLEQAHTQFMEQAQLAAELLNRDMKKYQAIDWNALKTENPVEYVAKQIEFQDLQKQKEELRQQAQQVYEHNLRVQAEEAQKMVEAEQKRILEIWPEWKDQEKAKSNFEEISGYAKAQGYSPQEIASIVKARDLVVLDKARKYDELMAKKETVETKRKPKVKKVVKSKGKEPKGRSQRRRIDESKQRLKKSGSLNAAAEYLYARQQGQKELRK